MNPQGFSFPPPPPPPPTQQQPQQQQYPHSTAYTPYGQNQHGQRGGRGGGGGNFRGRGRGYGNRGGRGGHFSSDANRPGGYTATAGGYAPMTYLGYPTQQMPTQQAGLPNTQYSQTSSQNYPNVANGNSFPSTSQYPHSPAHATPYQHQTGYGTSYPTTTTQQSPGYAQTPQAHQHATPSAQPPMMGPPMRWGFEGGQSFTGQQRSNQRGPRQNNFHNNQPGKHANKRDHNSAFGKSQSSAPRVPAPPPVPSFGNPLPLKPPVPADSPRKPKKKKRKHNQLGLTPKTEDHESSEEEDDADEETKLAAGGEVVGSGLQVTYRGRTSKLQSSAEIAAWIAERKKRFPTQAKVEEKKKAMEEANKAKKAKQEAQRQEREARKVAAQQARKEQEKKRKQRPPDSLEPSDAAAKAKLKAEKLRRKLEKEEKRIAQAEAEAERARKPGDSQEGSLENKPAVTADQGAEAANDSLPDTSDSDWTSSSGSDSSSSESDESDDDAPPEESSSRHQGPERVAPPAREEKKQACRHFARNGRCPRGKTCKFVHEKPERGTKTKPAENKGRKGLLEALLERQKEDENRKLMEKIVWLGENGHLDEPAAQKDASLDSTAANSAGDGHGQAQTHDDDRQTPAAEEPLDSPELASLKP